MIWVWLGLGLMADLTGIFLGKKYLSTNNLLFLIGAMASFALIGIFFTQLMKYENLAIANVLWMAGIAIFPMLMAFFYFKEKVTPLQTVGIIVILFGVLLIEWPGK